MDVCPFARFAIEKLVLIPFHEDFVEAVIHLTMNLRARIVVFISNLPKELSDGGTLIV